MGPVNIFGNKNLFLQLVNGEFMLQSINNRIYLLYEAIKCTLIKGRNTVVLAYRWLNVGKI